jgi:anthranilate synthase component I
MTYKFTSQLIKTLSDTHTPVELYLKLRDKFPHSFLLESSDYKSRENSYSYLCLQPLASFVVNRDETVLTFPEGEKLTYATEDIDISQLLQEFAGSFQTDTPELGFLSQGLFGYTSYDAIPLFEDIQFRHQDFDLPLMQYHLFRYLIVFNHFNNELYLLEHLLPGETSNVRYVQDQIAHRAVTQYPFATLGTEEADIPAEDFLALIQQGKQHCYRGDVFQVVLSRSFRQAFRGDEFNVYRALRSVNPSPYLFYFDYGVCKIFGSSPEAQLTIADHKAAIHPIAGTFRRSGKQAEDEALAEALRADPKENAEHVMLVDLARNDLSRNSRDVRVERYKEIEYYSHVIHLVSKVTAQLEAGFNPVKILGDTYPAGTLSGAPKHRAMQIIDALEPRSRGFYGGAVGFLGLDGSFNHAIFIRSFVSRHNTLRYQAGCGIVIKSDPELELKEVDNKLSALRQAIELAKTI